MKSEKSTDLEYPQIITIPNYWEDHLLNGLRDIQHKKIYHVLKYDYFLEWCKTSKMRLDHPSSWDDEFENILLNAQIKYPDGKLRNFADRRFYFAKCWNMMNVYSDLMWKVYSDKNSVRIRTTVLDLWRHFINRNTQFPINKNNCYMGKMDYKAKKDIMHIFSDFNNFEKILNQINGPEQSILIKRKLFDYEQEVRLIYRVSRYDNFCDDHVYLDDMDPRNFIDQIMFDPRTDYEIFKERKNILKEYFPKDNIRRSLIYQAPKMTIVIPEKKD